MVCRQAAATPSSNLWITDDILAEAWHRFARVSIANRRRTEGRRHGSNVPGPLEAQRRLAKRRMGVAAVISSGGMPANDWGAFWGWGGFERERRVGQYNYQAPEPPVEEKPKSIGTWWFGNSTKKKPDLWESFLDVPDPPEKDPVAESEKAFKAMLRARDHLKVISESDLQELREFLQSSADEPGARNTRSLAQWLSTRQIHVEGWKLLLKLVHEKTKLETLDTGDTSSILASLLRHEGAERPEIVALLLSVLDSVRDMRPIGRSVTEELANDAAELSEPSQVPRPLLLWLRCVQEARPLRGHKGHRYAVWKAIYTVLSARWPSPASLVDHFATLNPVQLCHVLLRHWVPQFGLENEPFSTPRETSGPTWKLLEYRTARKPRSSDLLREYWRTIRRRPLHAPRYSVRYLLGILKRFNIRHESLAHDIFSILLRSQTPGEVCRMFHLMNQLPSVRTNTDLAAHVARAFVARDRPDLAREIFDMVPTLAHEDCPDLMLALAHRGNAVWNIASRRMSRSTTSCPRKSRLDPKKIDLVHRVALAYAQASRFTPRTAFRRVHQCYLFLRDHSAPISPLIIRAFVHAGVIRPMKEGRRIYKDKVGYILSLVARWEGTEAADALDRLITKLWQERGLPAWRRAMLDKSVDDTPTEPLPVVPKWTRRTQRAPWSRRARTASKHQASATAYQWLMEQMNLPSERTEDTETNKYDLFEDPTPDRQVEDSNAPPSAILSPLCLMDIATDPRDSMFIESGDAQYRPIEPVGAENFLTAATTIQRIHRLGYDLRRSSGAQDLPASPSKSPLIEKMSCPQPSVAHLPVERQSARTTSFQSQKSLRAMSSPPRPTDVTPSVSSLEPATSKDSLLSEPNTSARPSFSARRFEALAFSKPLRPLDKTLSSHKLPDELTPSAFSKPSKLTRDMHAGASSARPSFEPHASPSQPEPSSSFQPLQSPESTSSTAPGVSRAVPSSPSSRSQEALSSVRAEQGRTAHHSDRQQDDDSGIVWKESKLSTAVHKHILRAPPPLQDADSPSSKLRIVMFKSYTREEVPSAYGESVEDVFTSNCESKGRRGRPPGKKLLEDDTVYRRLELGMRK